MDAPINLDREAHADLRRNLIVEQLVAQARMTQEINGPLDTAMRIVCGPLRTAIDRGAARQPDIEQRRRDRWRSREATLHM
jgi:hypothetical protein